MRVLLVRLSALGDLAQSLGAVLALHRARPDLELCLLTQRAFAPLLEGVEGLAAVVAHDRDGGLAAWFATRRRLRRLGCGLALDLQGNAKSALGAFLSGARERIGAGAAWRQEPWSRVFLTRTVAVPGPPHPALVARTLVRDLAPGADFGGAFLAASAAEIARAGAAVESRGVPAGAPFVVLVAGDPRDPRSQREAALRREVETLRGRPLLLLTGPDEAGLDVPPGVPVWRQGRGELRLLVGLGALVLRSGGTVIGPDRGATHVLAATGARTIALFGPQDPRRTAPPFAVALQHPRPPSCSPCGARRCRHPDGPVCMAFTSGEGHAVAAPDWLGSRGQPGSPGSPCAAGAPGS